MPNTLAIWAIRARHLLSHAFEDWLWWYKYFLSKVNISNVNCARAIAFIFDTRTDVLLKVSKFVVGQGCFVKQYWNHGSESLLPCWFAKHMQIFIKSKSFHKVRLTLQWRHNEHDGVSNHQPHDCLLNLLFRRRTKKTPKPRVTGLCDGNSPVTGEFPRTHGQ